MPVLKIEKSILLYSIKAGTRRTDGSKKSNVSDVTITEKGAPSFPDIHEERHARRGAFSPDTPSFPPLVKECPLAGRFFQISSPSYVRFGHA